MRQRLYLSLYRPGRGGRFDDWRGNAINGHGGFKAIKSGLLIRETEGD
jgi:hypothetical protein